MQKFLEEISHELSDIIRMKFETAAVSLPPPLPGLVLSLSSLTLLGKV